MTDQRILALEQENAKHRTTAFPSVSLHFQGYAYPALLPLLQGD